LSATLIIGPGAVREIRGVTEFEMPPGPQIARAIVRTRRFHGSEGRDGVSALAGWTLRA